MSDPYKELFDRLPPSDRMLITCLFFDTAKQIIIDKAPKDLTKNQLKRYVYKKMYDEPPPAELWR